MRMEKINSSQIRIVITSQDLQEWKLSVREMKYGSRETTELFRQMLQKAAQQFSFNQEGLPIMIEAVPIGPEELLLIISAVEDAEELDPHFAEYAETETDSADVKPEARFLETEAVEEMGIKAFVLYFKDIDEVITFCRQVPLYSGRSMLYRCEEGGFYLTLTRPEEMSVKEFNRFVNSSSEFGAVIPDSGILYARLQEHEKPVMVDPLVKLIRIR